MMLVNARIPDRHELALAKKCRTKQQSKEYLEQDLEQVPKHDQSQKQAYLLTFFTSTANFMAKAVGANVGSPKVLCYHFFSSFDYLVETHPRSYSHLLIN